MEVADQGGAMRRARATAGYVRSGESKVEGGYGAGSATTLLAAEAAHHQGRESGSRDTMRGDTRTRFCALVTLVWPQAS